MPTYMNYFPENQRFGLLGWSAARTDLRAFTSSGKVGPKGRDGCVVERSTLFPVGRYGFRVDLDRESFVAGS